MGHYWPELRIGGRCKAYGNDAELALEIKDDGYRRGYLRGFYAAINNLEKLIFHDGLSPLEASRVAIDLIDKVRVWAIKEKGDIILGPLDKVEPPYEIDPPNPGFIYFLRADNGLFKIGKTKNLDNRIKQLGIKLPYELELIHTIGTDEMHYVEREFHSRYADKQVRGEWFELTDDDIDFVKGIKYILTCGISEGAS